MCGLYVWNSSSDVHWIVGGMRRGETKKEQQQKKNSVERHERETVCEWNRKLNSQDTRSSWLVGFEVKQVVRSERVRKQVVVKTKKGEKGTKGERVKKKKEGERRERVKRLRVITGTDCDNI